MGALFGAGLLLAGLIPPPDAGFDAHQIANIVNGDRFTFRVGVLLMCTALPFYGFFTAGLAAHMKRIEGEFSPLTYAELGFGMLNLMLALLSGLWLLAAAFRDRPDQLTQLLSDMAWLALVALWMPAAAQWFSTALAIFSDDSDDPVFPRWTGYLSLWVVTLTLPSTVVFFVHSGPFAWNGIIGWWLTVSVFFIWIATMSITMLRATNRQHCEPSSQRFEPSSEPVPES